METKRDIDVFDSHGQRWDEGWFYSSFNNTLYHRVCPVGTLKDCGDHWTFTRNWETTIHPTRDAAILFHWSSGYPNLTDPSIVENR